MRMPTVRERTVLITGCSSGIGLATARRLRDCGWQAVPAVRQGKDRDALRAEGFDPVLLDLTDSASIADATQVVLERFGGGLGALVNNAGFGLTSALEDAPRAMFRDIFEVNVFGLQELTNRLIPVFRRQGFGRIVNISSVLGEVALPFVGIYSASKFALEALSDALRRELGGSGVAVSVIQPGPIETRFSQNLAFRTERYPLNPDSPFAAFQREIIETRKTGRARRTADAFTLPPEAVAERIRHALESNHPRRRYRVTVPAHAGAFARRAFPSALLDAVMRVGLKRKIEQTRREKDGSHGEAPATL